MLELQMKPDLERSLKRIDAWYQGELLDRAPVDFGPQYRHNEALERMQFSSLQERWMSVDYHMERLRTMVPEEPVLGDGIPNVTLDLGPVFFSALYGGEIVFGKDTSWMKPFVTSYDQPLHMQMAGNVYFDKMEELIKAALEQFAGLVNIGYPDLHPGLDCLACFRGSETLCFDLYEYPEELKRLSEQVTDDFERLFRHYHRLVTEHGQLSVSWISAPSPESMHIPSCDFSYMISPAQFEEFVLPVIQREVKMARRNVFHMDGPGVARHVDMICSVPEIQAVQWAPGAGETDPVTKWVPLLQTIRSYGKSVYVYVSPQEMDAFLAAMPPEGVFIHCDTTDREVQEQVLKKIEKWT